MRTSHICASALAFATTLFALSANAQTPQINTERFAGVNAEFLRSDCPPDGLCEYWVEPIGQSFLVDGTVPARVNGGGVFAFAESATRLSDNGYQGRAAAAYASGSLVFDNSGELRLASANSTSLAQIAYSINGPSRATAVSVTLQGRLMTGVQVTGSGYYSGEAGANVTVSSARPYADTALATFIWAGATFNSAGYTYSRGDGFATATDIISTESTLSSAPYINYELTAYLDMSSGTNTLYISKQAVFDVLAETSQGLTIFGLAFADPMITIDGGSGLYSIVGPDGYENEINSPPANWQAGVFGSAQPLQVSVSSPAPPPVVAVPEPSAWALLIGGFGFVGAALRRRAATAAA